MPADPRERGPETDGVLVRPIGGQIYLVEETDGGLHVPWEDPPAPDRSPLSGLINRH
jgi:hypothetical protein